MSSAVEKRVLGQVSGSRAARIRSCHNARFATVLGWACRYWEESLLSAVSGEFGIEWHNGRYLNVLGVGGICPISAAVMARQEIIMRRLSYAGTEGIPADCARWYDLTLDEVWGFIRGFDNLPIDYDLPPVLHPSWAAEHPEWSGHNYVSAHDGEIPVRVPSASGWTTGRYVRSVLDSA